jgi:hypothetical protein
VPYRREIQILVMATAPIKVVCIDSFAPMDTPSTRRTESENEKPSPKPASVQVVGFKLRPLKVGERAWVSVVIRNDSGYKVIMRNAYSMSLVPSVPNNAKDRRVFEERLWTGFEELQKTLSPDPLEIPPSVRGASLLSENDEGPVVSQEFLDKFWGRGGAVYILGVIKIDGESPITYCGFARAEGTEFVHCLARPIHECRRTMTGDADMRPSDDVWMCDSGCGRPMSIHATRWRGDDATADERSTASADTDAGVPR